MHARPLPLQSSPSFQAKPSPAQTRALPSRHSAASGLQPACAAERGVGAATVDRAVDAEARRLVADLSARGAILRRLAGRRLGDAGARAGDADPGAEVADRFERDAVLVARTRRGGGAGAAEARLAGRAIDRLDAFGSDDVEILRRVDHVGAVGVGGDIGGRVARRVLGDVRARIGSGVGGGRVGAVAPDVGIRDGIARLAGVGADVRAERDIFDSVGGRDAITAADEHILAGARRRERDEDAGAQAPGQGADTMRHGLRPGPRRRSLLGRMAQGFETSPARRERASGNPDGGLQSSADAVARIQGSAPGSRKKK